MLPSGIRVGPSGVKVRRGTYKESRFLSSGPGRIASPLLPSSPNIQITTHRPHHPKSSIVIMRFYVATLLLAVFFTTAVVGAPHALPAEAEGE